MTSMGWAGPSPAPSFALISPATITHDVCRRLVGAPGALSRASIRHASDTHDVATDAGHDGHTGGTIGIVLQHVECRPPCDLDHRARRARVRDYVSSLTLPSDRATLCGGTGA